MRWVSSLLDDTLVADIRWEELRVRSPNTSRLPTLLAAECVLCHRVLQYLPEVRGVIFSSISSHGLLALKMIMYGTRRRAPVLAVMHSMLDTLGKEQTVRSRWNILGLPGVMRLPHPEGLRYVVLGRSIQESLVATVPKLAVHFRCIDPPYLQERMRSTVDPTANHHRIWFGYLGVANDRFKGFARFLRLAKSLEEHVRDGKCGFLLAGFLEKGYEPGVDSVDLVEGMGHSVLSPEELGRRISILSFVVLTQEPDHYKLVASVTFQDALAHLKPCICLRNPFIEHYFRRMGDIGYLCENDRAMFQVLSAVVHDFPLERYLEQCENIRRGRTLFSPEKVAPELRNILNDVSLYGS